MSKLLSVVLVVIFLFSGFASAKPAQAADDYVTAVWAKTWCGNTLYYFEERYQRDEKGNPKQVPSEVDLIKNGSPAVNIINVLNVVSQAECTPDGKNILFISKSYGLYDFDLTATKLWLVAPGNVIGFDQSKSGKIAFSLDGGQDPKSSGIYTVDPDGKNLLEVIGASSTQGPVWSPDEKRIAYVDDIPNSSKNKLMVVTTNGVATEVGEDYFYYNLIWQGSNIYYGQLSGTDKNMQYGISGVNPDNGMSFGYVDSKSGLGVIHEFQLVGNQFIISAESGIYNFTGDGDHAFIYPDCTRPLVSPDGQQLAYITNNGDGQDVAIGNLTGQ